MALAPLREGVVNRMDLMETSEQDISAGDQIVLDRLACGEASAIAKLYDRYGSVLYSLMVCIVGDAPLAEDLVQEVFVRVWRFAGSYRREAGSVRGWLFAMAHHCAVDAWRRRQREYGWLSLEASTVNSLSTFEGEASDPFLARAIAELPDEQRQIIEMAYFHGLTMNEIAGCLHLPPGTVKSRIRLALEKLRARLGAVQEREP